ncbi:polysaccharide pyruvyl transferase family protein [Desulfogranum marinum]|uniref:polysaccharide pyruvyl transferase family protein n=1 Tax=Desulfogranum marinum TaxID=453220 RepID=UPI001963A483|nr:polysaccharide pyruvyl transferase family protein [Desulfogranum marinum]MBM9513276.1 polysaccharide pyruvyl transferase family protein [Desulfogranum marinum]
MKILIRGAGFQNKGAEAMLRVVQRELGIRIPEASFHATVTPLDAPYTNRSGVSPVITFPSTRLKRLRSVPIVSKAQEIFISLRDPDFSRAIKTSQKTASEINAIGHVDGVVDVSGFAYSDSWGPNNLKNTWAWVEYCLAKKKPYIFLPQAWGSFEKKETSFWAKRICQDATLVLSRDDESSNHLAKLQNIPSSDVRIAPDIAFRFRGAPEAVGRTIFRDLGLAQEGRPVITLVPNMRVYERTAETGASNQYVNLLVALTNYCIENLGTSVLLAPNEINVPTSGKPDDRFLCGIIESCTRKSEHCYTIREYYPSETIKAILGQSDLLIASRFHSLVFALSQGVPVLAIGWSHKYRELFRSFGLEDFVVNHNRLDTNSVLSLVESAWGQREGIGRQILETVPQLQEEIDELFDEVAATIGMENS